jgi:hypothetical protein
MKQLTKSLLELVGIEKTEKFFKEFELTRKIMEKFAKSEMREYPNPKYIAEYPNYSSYLAEYLVDRNWARIYLKNLKARKKEITFLTYSKKWCYVPKNLKNAIHFTREIDKLYYYNY